MAECHPVGFQWVMEAKARGATIIHIDPRFTRTSAMADVFVPLRAGSDIAFLGGIINYILSNEKYFREYVVRYTNAATIVSEDFQDADQLGGLFSGFDPTTGTYDTTSWAYEGMEMAAAAGSRAVPGRQPAAHAGGGATSSVAAARPCPTARSGATKASRIRSASFRSSSVTTRGTPPRWSSGSAASRRISSPRCARRSPPTAVASAPLRGCTRWGGRSTPSGVQYIRGAAIIQLLLGNMGRPGGGILALRGHASIQGSTDIPTLFDLLPGYLPMPKAGVHADLHGVPRVDQERRTEGLLDRGGHISRQPAQGMVGRRRHAGQRLRLRMAAAHQWRPQQLPDDPRHARRRRSKATSCSGRIPSSGRRTASCSGSRCRI